jgi:hypothetical protein
MTTVATSLAPPPTTARLALAGPLLAGAGAILLGAAYLHFRPDLANGAFWVLGEQGNQLYRAERLARGETLYGDVAMQYGPLPAYVYAGYTLLTGNTIAANHSWHLATSAACIALTFALVRRHAGTRAAWVGTCLLLLPLMLAPGGLMGGYTNFEHLSVERMCLLGLMLLWAPPAERSLSRNGLLGCCLGAWQLVKFGGAAFGGAAVVGVDLLWLLRFERPSGSIATWLRGLAVLVGVMAGIEALSAGAAFALLPADVARDAVWPAYVRESYHYLGLATLFSWLGWKGLLFQQIPLLVCAALAALGMGYPLVRREGAALALWIGPAFYLLAALAYFGHADLYLQFAWALAPAACYTLNCLPRPAWGVMVLLLMPAPLMMIKVTLLNHPEAPLTTFRLPGGEELLVDEVARRRLELISDAAARSRDAGPDGFALAVFSWEGGGFHHFYDPHYGLRNYLVAPVAFRPYDVRELGDKLDRVGVLLVKGSSEPGEARAELAAALGPEAAERLLAEFEWESEAEGYAALVRRVRPEGHPRDAARRTDRPKLAPGPG